MNEAELRLWRLLRDFRHSQPFFGLGVSSLSLEGLHYQAEIEYVIKCIPTEDWPEILATMRPEISQVWAEYLRNFGTIT